MTKATNELYMIVKARILTSSPDLYVKVTKTKEEALAYMKAYGLNSMLRLFKVSSKSNITIEEFLIEFDPQITRSHELTTKETKA